MDVKLGILIILNMAPPQKLVLAPGAIIRGNTIYHIKICFTTKECCDGKLAFCS